MRPNIVHTDPAALSRKDFIPSTEVRWCAGCADYSVLAQVQRTLPTLGIPKENFVFVSGIGCSSRFPYYMDTYGLHTVHGRAPAIATGVKLANPELSVWVITGDGDGLSIGGNHLLHALRRNIGLKILLFNNRIYGLTKGQYSPTSELGKKTKSTPQGSVDYPVDPVSFALGAGATFVARVIANDAAMLQEVLRRMAAHRGTAFVELYQNCVIFNEGAFDGLTEGDAKHERQLRLEQGQPLRFGKEKERGIVVDQNGRPSVVSVAEVGEQRLLRHDEGSDTVGFLLSRLSMPDFPMPLGVFRAVERPAYEEMMRSQLPDGPRRPLRELFASGETWTVG